MLPTVMTVGCWAVASVLADESGASCISEEVMVFKELLMGVTF